MHAPSPAFRRTQPSSVLSPEQSPLKRPRSSPAAPQLTKTLLQSTTYRLERWGRFPTEASELLQHHQGGDVVGKVVTNGWCLVTSGTGIIMWDARCGDQDEARGLAPPFVALEHPAGALNSDLVDISDGGELVAASPDGHLRFWADARTPHRVCDLAVEVNDGSIAAEVTVTKVLCLDSDDIACGLSSGTIWRLKPSSFTAQKLVKSSGTLGGLLQSLTAMVGLTPAKEGISAGTTEQGNDVRALAKVQLVRGLGLLCMTVKDLQLWWLDSPSSTSHAWDFCLARELAMLLGEQAEDVELIDMQSMPGASSHLVVLACCQGSYTLHHVAIPSTGAGGVPDVTVIHTAALQGAPQVLSLGLPKALPRVVVEELPEGAAKATVHVYWPKPSASSSVAVVTVDCLLNSTTEAEAGCESSVLVPNSTFPVFIGGGTGLGGRGGLVLMSSKGHGCVALLHHLGHQQGSGLTPPATKQRQRDWTSRMPSSTSVPAVPAGIIADAPALAHACCTAQRNLVEEWMSVINSAFRIHRTSGMDKALDLIAPLTAAIDAGDAAAQAAVVEASVTLVDARPGAGYDWAGTGQGKDQVPTRDLGQNVPYHQQTQHQLVHYTLAEKVKKHLAFVSFLQQVGAWKGLVWARTVVAEHGEKLASTAEMSSMLGRLSQRPAAGAAEALSLLQEGITSTLEKRGITQDELKKTGLSASDFFFSCVTGTTDGLGELHTNPSLLPRYMNEANQSDGAAVINVLSGVISAMQQAAFRWREQQSHIYSCGTRAFPWTSSEPVRGLVSDHLALYSQLRSLKLEAAAHHVGGLAKLLLGGYKMQEECGGVKRGGEGWEEWCRGYEKAKDQALYPLMRCDVTLAKELALLHRHFQGLLRLCDEAGEAGRRELIELMIQLHDVVGDSAPHETFPQYVLGQLYRQGRPADLLECGAAVPALMSRFLGEVGAKELDWVHLMCQGNYTDATQALCTVAVEEEESLAERKTLLSLAKLSHLCDGEEEGSICQSINDSLIIASGQAWLCSGGGGQADLSAVPVEDWQMVIERAAKAVNESAGDVSVEAALAGLDVYDAAQRQGKPYWKKGFKGLWTAVISTTLKVPAIAAMIERQQDSQTVSDLQIEEVGNWKSLFSILRLLIHQPMLLLLLFCIYRYINSSSDEADARHSWPLHFLHWPLSGVEAGLTTWGRASGAERPTWVRDAISKLLLLFGLKFPSLFLNSSRPSYLTDELLGDIVSDLCPES
ncbi:unnamed protein product, partial [Chrysoparadoxa australica]